MKIPNSNNVRRRVVIILLAVALVAIAFGVSWKYLGNKGRLGEQSDYIIPGVQYIGIYNHKGSLAYTAYDLDSGIDSILEYWDPGKNNFEDIRKSFDFNSQDRGSFGQISKFFELKKDYKVEEVSLGLEDLKKYINPDSRTPLLVWLPISKDQPIQIAYHPIRVLIGIKWSESKLIFHDYWLGNNYEISFDDYKNLWQSVQPEGRNKYILIQPVDLEKKMEEVKGRKTETYPAKTRVMSEAEGMFKNYGMGAGAYLSSQWDVALSYFTKIEFDPKFGEWFPPQFKTRVLYEIGHIYLEKKEYDKALNYLNRAAEMNHDLDKPFKDWPGYELRNNNPSIIDRLPHPYLFLGDYYYGQKDFKKAEENYQKALDIRPMSNEAQRGLRLSESKL